MTLTTLRTRAALIAVAASLACCQQSIAAEATAANGTIRVKAGGTEVAYAPDKGTVTIRGEGVDIERKGMAFLLSPGGEPADLKAAARADGTVDLGDATALTVGLTLYETPRVDAIGIINLTGQQQTVSVSLDTVGLPADAVFAGHDLQTNEFLGPISGTLARVVKPNGRALIGLGQAGAAPVLLSTSRSASRGAPDVTAVSWDAGKKVLSGTSSVEAEQKYELRLFAPPEPMRLVAETVSCAQAEVDADTMQTRQWLRVMLSSPKAQQVQWQVAFTEKPARETKDLTVKLSAEAQSARVVQLRCFSGGEEVLIRRSDGAQLSVSSPYVRDTTVAPDTEYTYSVHPVSWSEQKPALAQATVKTPALPPLPPMPDVHLADMKALRMTNGWNGDPRRNLSIEDNPLSIRGEVFEKGMGAHAPAEFVYAARPYTKRFVAVVGVDDEKNDAPSGSVTFEVYADDRELFKSDVLTPFHERVSINVAIPEDAKEIRLVVGDGGNGNGCDHADWCNAGFLTLGEPVVDPPDPAPEGFAELFNGKDLSGWDGDPQFWSVKDGVLRGETTPEKVAQGNTFLVWRGGKLKDFVLKLKFRIREGKFGVRCRGRDLGDGRISGYRTEGNRRPGEHAIVEYEAGRGDPVQTGHFEVVEEGGERKVVGQVPLEDVLTAGGYCKHGYFMGEGWHEYTITARGNHVVCELNGERTVELIDDDATQAFREGLLALQVGVDSPAVVEFKDLWLKQLTANYGNAIRLFNGENLDGWVLSNDALKDTWSVKNGVLDNTGKPAGYLRTTADYDNYVLRVQLRHVTNGNSGVLCRMVGEDKVWPRSIECQGQKNNLGDIWNIDEFPMKTAPERTNGRHTRKAHQSNENPLGEWNQYDLTLDGGTLEIRVNGLLQNTATECWETPGKICLQSEGAHVQFRNVVLIPILKDGE